MLRMPLDEQAAGSEASSDYRAVLASHEHLLELGAIERAAAQLFPQRDLPKEARVETVPAGRLRAAQAAGRLWVVLARAMQPVGFALVELVDGNAHLAELDVHPRHGRKGLGSLLLRQVVEWARREGLPAVTLTTFSHIPWNAPFYGRAGFRILPQREIGPSLRKILDAEASRGLHRRVAMSLELRQR